MSESWGLYRLHRKPPLRGGEMRPSVKARTSAKHSGGRAPPRAAHTCPGLIYAYPLPLSACRRVFPPPVAVRVSWRPRYASLAPVELPRWVGGYARMGLSALPAYPARQLRGILRLA